MFASGSFDSVVPSVSVDNTEPREKVRSAIRDGRIGRSDWKVGPSNCKAELGIMAGFRSDKAREEGREDRGLSKEPARRPGS